MKPIKFLVVLMALIFTASIKPQSFSYDPSYENGTHSLNVVACSDSANSLITPKSWSSLPLIMVTGRE
jgi:hypothetical protein